MPKRGFFLYMATLIALLWIGKEFKAALPTVIAAAMLYCGLMVAFVRTRSRTERQNP